MGHLGETQFVHTFLGVNFRLHRLLNSFHQLFPTLPASQSQRIPTAAHRVQLPGKELDGSFVLCQHGL